MHVVRDHDNRQASQERLTEEEIQQSIVPEKKIKQTKCTLQQKRAPSTRKRKMRIPESVVSWDDFEALEDWME